MDTSYHILKDQFSLIFPMMKIFSINSKNYLYDSKSNFLVEVSINELNELLQQQSEQKYINKLTQNGVFNPGFLEKVVPDDNDINTIIQHQFSTYVPRKFILEVTEDCTLRCKYCFFSKDTNNRKHSKKTMSENVAYQAIDYYYKTYSSIFSKIPKSERKKILKIAVPGISWWGGEPFMNFDLMKKTKKYVETLPWSNLDIDRSQLVYSVVTNFTFLNEKIIDFLLNTNIYLFVSLDGDKKEHDTNRVYANGLGSFNKVIENINYMLNNYPEFCKNRMVIQSVLSDNIDISSPIRFMEDHFALNSPLQKKILKYISFPQRKEMIFLSELYTYTEDCLQQFKSKLDKLASLETDDLVKLLNTNHNLLKEFEDLLSLENVLTFDNPQGTNYHVKHFSCPIGTDIIHISCNGDIHICNKTDNSFPLGNVKSGLNAKLLFNLYSNYYSGFRNKCNTCWVFKFCKVCPANILYKGKFYYPTNEECERVRKNFYYRMSKYILFSQYHDLHNRITLYYVSKGEKNFLNFEGPITINHFSHEKN